MEKLIHILVIEDEKEQLDLLAGLLKRSGYQVSTAENLTDAKEILSKQSIDVVFSDWKLDTEDGLQTLSFMRDEGIDAGFILATGHGSISHAVEAIRAGADDYLVKPYQKESLLFAIEKVCKARDLYREKKALELAFSEREKLIGIVGRAPCMQLLYSKIERLADTPVTVLITGESGTGKELTAMALHELSERKKEVFVAVNCASIPESLADAELFGAEKGSYTGANKQKIGKFEYADGGTIFLDEIGEMPLNIQAKILRVLQEGTFTRIGGNKEIKVDVRLIAATNRDLAEEVELGNFRKDLFYRLNIVPIVMPALRDRSEDIPELVEHFAEVASRRYKIEKVKFTGKVLKKLMSYYWPGNVRELGNVVDRLMLMSVDGVINEDEIPNNPAPFEPDTFVVPLTGMDWEEHEKKCILQILEIADRNKSQAAKLLNMSYKTFLYRLEKILK